MRAAGARDRSQKMGCFLACFGFSQKKKRRKHAHKVAAGDHRRGSYVPLDSSIRIIGAKESPNSESRDKPKEKTSLKVRKKVSFNPNVQTYEPISTDEYHFLESDGEEEMGKNSQEISKGSLSTSASKRVSTTLRMGFFPSNYRYQNIRDSYDEEDHIADEESDLDEDGNDEDDDDYDADMSENDDQRVSQEGLFCSSSINGELEYTNARDKIHYIHSVLSPVENLSQWKAAKAKAAAPKQQKENIALSQEPRMPYSSRSKCNHSKPLLQEIPVHASLSSWLHSPK